MHMIGFEDMAQVHSVRVALTHMVVAGDGGNGSSSPVACRQRQQPAKTTEPTAKAMPTMIRITEEP